MLRAQIFHFATLSCSRELFQLFDTVPNMVSIAKTFISLCIVAADQISTTRKFWNFVICPWKFSRLSIKKFGPKFACTLVQISILATKI